MEEIKSVMTKSGKKISFLYRTDPPRGAMKHTYFTPERDYVVQFFHHSAMEQNAFLLQRLEAILGKYNPTLSQEQGGAKGNEEKWAKYFQKRFCWPVDIVMEPELGIVCPAYPKNFFFDKSASDLLNLNGKDKKSTWYTQKHRSYLNEAELGDLKGLLEVSLMLAQSVRRMHQAGLAHSDLSCNNVLIDPKSGSCIIIDIDSLVVPGIFPPEVIGTRGYIAPEVLKSLSLERRKRVGPSVYTDLHALPVLIYEYLFCRHPLEGKKVYDQQSQSRNAFLKMGKEALFAEHPLDASNRPLEMPFTIKDMGEHLERLFLKAFAEGLHAPEKRPAAMEWERGLFLTLDLLLMCPNTKCKQKWFVSKRGQSRCPFCGAEIEKTPYFKAYRSVAKKQGQWTFLREIHIFSGKILYDWHFYDNVSRNEKAEAIELAIIVRRNGKWFLQNKGIQGLYDGAGNFVPQQGFLEIKYNTFFKARSQEHDLLFYVAV